MAKVIIKREQLEPTEAEKVIAEALRERGIEPEFERTIFLCPTCGAHLDILMVGIEEE